MADTELKTKTVHIVWTNSDLTEGRGHPIPLHVCEIEATARRLALRAGVMGGDADVGPFDAIWHRGQWCAPRNVEKPTAQDLDMQNQLDARARALAKAKAAGLTAEDLRAMGVA